MIGAESAIKKRPPAASDEFLSPALAAAYSCLVGAPGPKSFRFTLKD